MFIIGFSFLDSSRDSLRHGSTGYYSPVSRNAGVSEDDELEEELRQLIGSLCLGSKSEKSCLTALLKSGFQSVQSLDSVSVQSFVNDIGLNYAQAYGIVREVSKWLPRFVFLHCQDDAAFSIVREIKPKSSLQLLRSTISELYPDYQFVFVRGTKEIHREQESTLPIFACYGSEPYTIDIKSLSGKLT